MMDNKIAKLKSYSIYIYIVKTDKNLETWHVAFGHQENVPIKLYHLEPPFYIVKLVSFTGVYLFSFVYPKHRLWVLVRTPSPMQFSHVPAILCILHGHVVVMN